MVDFAVDEIEKACNDRGVNLKVTSIKKGDIVFKIDSFAKQIQPEGFEIIPDKGSLTVLSTDRAGAMYGGLELAEQIKLYGLKGVKATVQNPYMKRRGTKFNIPLDVRTPSYTDPCDAAQNNIATMWDFDFWKEYIDNLARNRYNFISLWNLHPFPSMVKVPAFPDIALNDVQRSTLKWDEHYSLNALGLDAPEIIDNVEILKNLTIEEKIDFWQKVMCYAKDRNIEFYVLTWNIFVNGTNGKYEITDNINNKTTRDYFRQSVKQLFVTYPDLAGIGVTTGENMHDASVMEKEDWVYETYAKGLLDAAAEMPERKFTFIHRQHMAGHDEIVKKFQPLIDNKNIEFLFSFKYAEAHCFSSTTQPLGNWFAQQITGMKTMWTLRNDDNYQFRWGAPGFVREFIKNIPYDVSEGFYYGSDQWIWGREFLSKDPGTLRQLEIVKHWYHWMLWGRFGYNPDLPDDRLIHIIQNRFPSANAEKLFTAWQEASLIYPTTTGFHWGALDFQWYIEACKSREEFAQNETGFHDVNRFINLPPHPGTGYQSIPDYIKSMDVISDGQKITPFDVSKELHNHADSALSILIELGTDHAGELGSTISDIQTMAYLGKYYAHKIAGSTYVALYRETKDLKHQKSAIEELSNAFMFWKKYTESALVQYKNPLWTNRVGYVDWTKLTEWVKQDIEIAKIKL